MIDALRLTTFAKGRILTIYKPIIENKLLLTHIKLSFAALGDDYSTFPILLSRQLKLSQVLFVMFAITVSALFSCYQIET